MDAETQKAHTAWGSFADAEFIQSGALSHMRGKFGYVWAGAVLHVLTKDEVRALLTHAHAMLAPNGTFFGVSPHVLTAELQALPAARVYLHRANPWTSCRHCKSSALHISFVCCPRPLKEVKLPCHNMYSMGIQGYKAHHKVQ